MECRLFNFNRRGIAKSSLRCVLILVEVTDVSNVLASLVVRIQYVSLALNGVDDNSHPNILLNDVMQCGNH